MADQKISALPAASAVVATNEFAINEAGTSKKVTAAQVASFSAIGSYAPGSFTIPTGKYVVMSKRLQLTGSQRVTLQGTARLRIS